MGSGQTAQDFCAVLANKDAAQEAVERSVDSSWNDGPLTEEGDDAVR